jgi:hypothetical protein
MSFQALFARIARPLAHHPPALSLNFAKINTPCNVLVRNFASKKVRMYTVVFSSDSAERKATARRAHTLSA